MIIVYEVLNFFNFPRPKVESKKICCFSRNSIALALAKHCIGSRKALRGNLQTIVLRAATGIHGNLARKFEQLLSAKERVKIS